jgi:hypothetical protein
MFFTEELLEQATSEQVSLFKGKHYFKDKDCADLCCGAGGTTIGMAQYASSVTAVDSNEVHLAMAEHNLGLYGDKAKVKFRQMDITKEISRSPVYHFDPSRRTEMQRSFMPEEYIPPLSTVESILEQSPDVIAKVSPLFSLTESGEYSADIISLNGEVKEILLCYGRFNKNTIRAIILPEEEILVPDPSISDEDEEAEPKTYLFEPDPAVVKGGMVPSVAKKLGLSIITPEVRYLTGEQAVESPFVKTFEIMEVLPFSYKQLNRYLKRNSIGNISVKCKDSAIKTGSITKKLKPKGNGTAFLFYIDRGGNDKIFILAKKI